MPKILFTSVFKPFGVDNLYSRVDSKLELFHNQITKYQQCFSPRMNFCSYGLHAIANNINTPSVVLDFPSRRRFRRELKKGYDYVGISSITANFTKVKVMVEDIQELSPESKIIIGGFCASIPNLKELLKVDYICIGEGISFMRGLLGEPADFDFKQPDVYDITKQIFGVPLIIPKYRPYILLGLGCSYGCDFCSPSHHFGRKHIKFLKTGKDIFDEVERLGKKYNADRFPFMGDDNFLLDRKRAEELRELVIKSGKQYFFFTFASADLVSAWDPAELAEMGVDVIWVGRESNVGRYKKNDNINMKELVSELNRYGIKTVLSSILLLDEHDKENILRDIDDHIDVNPAFSQFCFYTPVPGTPLYDRLKEENRLPEGIPYEEIHAFKQPWLIHPNFTFKEAELIQESAYLRDYHELGPSITRLIDTHYLAYMHMKDSSRETLRNRAKSLMKDVKMYRAMLLASEHLVPKPEMAGQIKEIRCKIEAEFGETTAFEKVQAAVLTAFGKKQNFRMKHFGDAISTKTIRVEFKGNEKN